MTTLRRTLIVACSLIITIAAQAVEETWLYAVQLTAEVQAEPARITLTWVPDATPPQSYTIYRKAPGETSWGNGVELPGTATTYTDENVGIGRIYEYQVVKVARYAATGATYRAYGYLASAINAPLVDVRGKVVLVVDRSIAGAIGREIDQLRSDLIGDGWKVVRVDVNRDDAPTTVKAAIKAEYDADRDGAKAVFLLGHVPVLRSGNLNVDGHQARPLPADAFYGDMDGEWTDANGDGIYDQSLLPSDVELQVGRVDFADLTGATVGYTFPSEVELLKRYLAKDHAFRHAIVRPAARALVANPIGDGGGQAYAASGYRNFSVLVGPKNIFTIESQTDTPVEERFSAQLGKRDYLWAYGCGAGGDFTVNALGAHGEFNGLWSQDFIEQKAKTTFYQFFGSWFLDWSKPDNLLRSALTAPDYGLASSWSGRPHHFFHSLGIGETLGYAMRLTQNNSNVGPLYQNQVQRQLHGIHIALMGDPTLRMTFVAPPAEATATAGDGATYLTWKASPDAVIGYHVYRSINDGEFVRLTNEPIPDLSFGDNSGSSGAVIYMIRAVALQVGPSGSYYNASEGAFTSPVAGAVPRAAAEPDAALAPRAGDVVWVDDGLPIGAVAFATENDRWNWVTQDPTPFSGSRAHQSDAAAGLHHHFFGFSETPLAVKTGDTLFAYVYLDPANPPRQIMLTWLAGDWEHRAYWGENLIPEGSDGTASRRVMGPLPPVGRWVRLELPASAVNMEEQLATGMGFSLFDGRATWDRTGKSRR